MNIKERQEYLAPSSEVIQIQQRQILCESSFNGGSGGNEGYGGGDTSGWY